MKKRIAKVGTAAEGQPGTATTARSEPSHEDAPRLRRYMPDARECAMLLLRLIEVKEADVGGPLSRFRVSEFTLEDITGRRRIRSEFIEEMNQWLYRAGRVLFFSGESFGVILTSAVESWSRLSYKWIGKELDDVATGEFDFTKIEHLLQTKRREQSGES